MDPVISYILISLAIVLAAVPVTGGRATVKEKELAKLCRRQGLPLPPGLRASVLDRVRTRERTMLAWGLGAVALGALTGLIVPVSTDADLRALPIFFLASLGLTIGSYRGALRSSGRIDPCGPRVAGSRSKSLADYSTKEERLAARLVPAAIALSLLATLAVWFMVPVKPPGGLYRPALIVLAAVGIVVMSLLLCAARTRVVNRPQHAGNDLELAWDDALRAAAIRDLQDVAIVSGLLGTLGLLLEALTWMTPLEVRDGAETLAMPLSLFAFGVGVACWALLLLPWLAGRAQKNPSLGMWPGARFRTI